MITLANVRDLLKTFNIADNYYIGKLDDKKDKSFGVYQLNGRNDNVKAIGNEKGYYTKGISILIHWNNNANETEIAAKQLYDLLDVLENGTLIGDGHKIFYVRLLQDEPVDVSSDKNGIYERVIELVIYYM